MAHPRLVQAVLLSFEFIISVAGVLYFGLAGPGPFDSQTWENAVVADWKHTGSFEVPLMVSQRLAASNLAIAILTLIIFVTRVIALRLEYLPSYANVLYDVLLLTLWSVSLAGHSSLVDGDSPRECKHSPYLAGGFSESAAQNPETCRVAQASFAFALLAVMLYAVRLLSYLWVVKDGGDREYHFSWTSKGGPNEPMSGVDVGLESAAFDSALREREQWYGQPLSPVLAFFPQTPTP